MKRTLSRQSVSYVLFTLVRRLVSNWDLRINKYEAKIGLESSRQH